MQNTPTIDFSQPTTSTSVSQNGKTTVTTGQQTVKLSALKSPTQTFLNDCKKAQQKRNVKQGHIWSANMENLKGMDIVKQFFKNIALWLQKPSQTILNNTYEQFVFGFQKKLEVKNSSLEQIKEELKNAKTEIEKEKSKISNSQKDTNSPLNFIFTQTLNAIERMQKQIFIEKSLQELKNSMDNLMNHSEDTNFEENAEKILKDIEKEVSTLRISISKSLSTVCTSIEIPHEDKQELSTLWNEPSEKVPEIIKKLQNTIKNKQEISEKDFQAMKHLDELSAILDQKEELKKLQSTARDFKILSEQMALLASCRENAEEALKLWQGNKQNLTEDKKQSIYKAINEPIVNKSALSGSFSKETPTNVYLDVCYKKITREYDKIILGMVNIEELKKETDYFRKTRENYLKTHEKDNNRLKELKGGLERLDANSPNVKEYTEAIKNLEEKMKNDTAQYNDEIKKLRENYNNQKKLVETFDKAFRTNYDQPSAQELYFADKNNEPPSL